MSNSVMPKFIPFHLSLIRDSLHSTFNSTSTPLHHLDKNSYSVIWLQNGDLEINGQSLAQGTGRYIEPTDVLINKKNVPATLLRFIVSKTPLSTPCVNTTTASTHEIIFEQPVNLQTEEMILRLDQVDFPPAAVAYKHTHPGPGIRYLVEGGLTLKGDHGTQQISTGEAWFEDADSTVEATAMDNTRTRFVRTLLLPSSYQGKSSFTLADEANANKPRLQTNLRHLEKLVELGELH